MSKRKNSRINVLRGIDGVRIVSMFVERVFRWGWQETDQKNDDGIDGYIIIRDRSGMDLGAMIKVQVKSGPSYFSSRSIDNKGVRIKPYSDKNTFKRHLFVYSHSICPVILVWVNTQRIENGKLIDDYNHPEIWWRRLDDYKYQDEGVITLDKKFGEHSKGDLFGLVKSQIKSWLEYPELRMDKSAKDHFDSLSLKEEALRFYRGWKENKTTLFWERRNYIVKINRTGWRHINNYKRKKDRVCTSLKLLPLAQQIIENRNIRPAFLNKKEYDGDLVREHYGFRCRVYNGNQMMKVQVVLIRLHSQYSKKKDRWKFYSLHEVK